MRGKITATLVCLMFIVTSVTVASSSLGDWVPADGHKMHWPQPPDLSDTGLAVELPFTSIRADDFRCNETGYITDIHIWGSFENDDLPALGPGGLLFNLSIWSNIPASPYPYYNYSRPGQVLWSKFFSIGEYSVVMVADDINEGWYNPEAPSYTPNDHQEVYLYNFQIDEAEAFEQEEGTIYWLGIRQYFTATPEEDFGWKVTTLARQWNDNAVRLTAAGWVPLSYPIGHNYTGQPLDFAFVINGVPPLPTLTVPPWWFTPVTLNLASKGRWVMAQLEPPEGYEAEDIVFDTVLLEDKVPVDWGKITGENVMLKFDRSDVEDILIDPYPPWGRPAEFKISGRLADGTPFVGYSEPVTIVYPEKF